MTGLLPPTQVGQRIGLRLTSGFATSAYRSAVSRGSAPLPVLGPCLPMDAGVGGATATPEVYAVRYRRAGHKGLILRALKVHYGKVRGD